MGHSQFKETQLANIKPGQTARIHVDALRRDFDGTVEDIGGATGAMASVLPPENATGNYVKVVQRTGASASARINREWSACARHVNRSRRSHRELRDASFADSLASQLEPFA